MKEQNRILRGDLTIEVKQNISKKMQSLTESSQMKNRTVSYDESRSSYGSYKSFTTQISKLEKQNIIFQEENKELYLESRHLKDENKKLIEQNQVDA
jgi:hypothetical protein